MVKRKKLCSIICFVTFLFATIGLLIGNKNVNVFKTSAEIHDEFCLFNHYDAVAPSEDCHGSKEFWACCAHHSFLLTEPEVGTIHDVGVFSGQFFDNLSESDDRFIPALPKTRTIRFFCDDYLCETQYVKSGNRINPIESSDFTFNGWYKEKELQNVWDFSEDIVDDNLDLYADYIVLDKNISFNSSYSIEVDEYGFGTSVGLDDVVCVSKGKNDLSCFATLDSRGILFNKEEIGFIDELSICIRNESFHGAMIYYGNAPFSLDYSQELCA